MGFKMDRLHADINKQTNKQSKSEHTSCFVLFIYCFARSLYLVCFRGLIFFSILPFQIWTTKFYINENNTDKPKWEFKWLWNFYSERIK